MANQVRLEKKARREVGHLHYVITRCLVWGFSSSGVERTFPAGGWLKGKREVTTGLANDELRAICFPEGERAELLVSFKGATFETNGQSLQAIITAEAYPHGSAGVGSLAHEFRNAYGYGS